MTTVFADVDLSDHSPLLQLYRERDEALMLVTVFEQGLQDARNELDGLEREISERLKATTETRCVT